MARDYLGWQQTVLRVLQAVQLDESGRLPLSPDYMEAVKAALEAAAFDRRLLKDALSFASFRMRVRKYFRKIRGIRGIREI